MQILENNLGTSEISEWNADTDRRILTGLLNYSNKEALDWGGFNTLAAYVSKPESKPEMP